MARKVWTQEEVDELVRRVCDKVGRKEKLTAGEDVIWGVICHGKKPLDVRYVEEVDFMMGFD